jgi:hypothetical protein
VRWDFLFIFPLWKVEGKVIFYPSFQGKDLSKRLFLGWHAKGEGWLFLRVEGLGFFFFFFLALLLKLEYHDSGEIFSQKKFMIEG